MMMQLVAFKSHASNGNGAVRHGGCLTSPNSRASIAMMVMIAILSTHGLRTHGLRTVAHMR